MENIPATGLDRVVAWIDSAERPMTTTLQEVRDLLYPGQSLGAVLVSLRVDLPRAGLGASTAGTSPTSEVVISRVGPPISLQEQYEAALKTQQDEAGRGRARSGDDRRDAPIESQRGPQVADRVAVSDIPTYTELIVRPVVSIRPSPDQAAPLGGALLRQAPHVLEIEVRVDADSTFFAYVVGDDGTYAAVVNLTGQLDLARNALLRIRQNQGELDAPHFFQFTSQCPHVAALLIHGSTTMAGYGLEPYQRPDDEGRLHTMLATIGAPPGDPITTDYLRWAVGVADAAWQLALEWAAFAEGEFGAAFIGGQAVGPTLSEVADFVQSLGKIVRGVSDVLSSI